MNLKSKLVVRIIQFILVLILVLLGIFAIYNANVFGEGAIIPSAEGVNATIKGSISGANEICVLKDLNYSEENQPSNDELSTWKNNLTFRKTKEDIVLTITIENKSTEESLFVNIQDKSQNITNLKRVVTNGAEEYTLGEKIELKPTTGDGTSTITFVITFSIVDKNYSINKAPYEYIIELEGPNKEA